jgi:hypothetical protein
MSDPIGAAIHAEAEEARAEIRAEGILCPSCGVNMADLPPRHHLAFRNEPHPDLPKGLLPAYAECRDGQRVCLLDAPFDAVKAAANISLSDTHRWLLAEAMIGTGRIAHP